MKIAKVLSAFFAVLAVALIVATVMAYVNFHQTPPMYRTSVEEAEKRTELLMEAMCAADYSAAGKTLYGEPELKWDSEAASELGGLLWQAYGEAMTYEFSGPCYGTASGIYRDVTVTVLDIPALNPKIQERFLMIMDPYLEGTRNESKAFDESGALRQEFASDILHQAAEWVLREDNACSSYQIALELVFQNDQWWIVPSQPLIDIIAGTVTQ